MVLHHVFMTAGSSSFKDSSSEISEVASFEQNSEVLTSETNILNNWKNILYISVQVTRIDLVFLAFFFFFLCLCIFIHTHIHT